MKGAIQPDHIPKNKYSLKVVGLPPITFTFVGSLEEELEKVDMPDRTAASGGNTKSTEFNVRHPTHHVAERIAMENWFHEGQDPVSPNYKKVGTLTKQSISGMAIASYVLQGLFVWKRVTPDLEMSNEGELDELEWSMSVDTIIPR
jgi:hypothetical protein